MTASSKLAEFALTTFSQEIPKAVCDVAILAIIDQYGLQIGGSEFAWSKSIHQYTKKYAGIGSSTDTRYGDQLPAVQAAFINSSLRMHKTLTTAIKKRKHIQEVLSYWPQLLSASILICQVLLF